MVKDTVLYDRLGINPDANEEQIRKAYNQLSKKWHPDKNQDNIEEAKNKFQEISEAKEILLDSNKKEMYDRFGMDSINGNVEVADNIFGNGNPFGPGHPFGHMFNGNFNFNNEQKQKENKNIIQNVNVTLKQIYNEENININYKYKSLCTQCNGEGTKDGKPLVCETCNGRGVQVQVIRIGNMIQQLSQTCQTCNGSGKSQCNNNNNCNICNGKGNILKEKSIQVGLKAGLTTGNKIHLQGKGNHYKNIKTDLILVINELSDSMYKRIKNDLIITVELKLYQALFGFSKIITHLDNRNLIISYNGKTDYNTIRKIPNEGMKIINSNKKGDLYIKFVFTLPTIEDMNLKTQLKNPLYAIDNNEVLNELNINKCGNINKVNLFNCSNEEMDHINKLLLDVKNEDLPSPNEDDSEDNQPRPQFNTHFNSSQQCAQQ